MGLTEIYVGTHIYAFLEQAKEDTFTFTHISGGRLTERRCDLPGRS